MAQPEAKPEKDRCVICQRETPYWHDAQIDMRLYYVETAGQLCQKCYEDIYELRRPLDE